MSMSGACSDVPCTYPNVYAVKALESNVSIKKIVRLLTRKLMFCWTRGELENIQCIGGHAIKPAIIQASNNVKKIRTHAKTASGLQRS